MVSFFLLAVRFNIYYSFAYLVLSLVLAAHADASARWRPSMGDGPSVGASFVGDASFGASDGRRVGRLAVERVP
jgi:hypothetical protein